MGSFRRGLFFALVVAFEVRIYSPYLAPVFRANLFVCLACRGEAPCFIIVFFAVLLLVIQAFCELVRISANLPMFLIKFLAPVGLPRSF